MPLNINEQQWYFAIVTVQSWNSMIWILFFFQLMPWTITPHKEFKKLNVSAHILLSRLLQIFLFHKHNFSCVLIVHRKLTWRWTDVCSCRQTLCLCASALKTGFENKESIYNIFVHILLKSPNFIFFYILNSHPYSSEYCLNI